MKSINSKIVMSAVAILLAICGSFATHASEKQSSAIIPGYVNLKNSTLPPCSRSFQCSDVKGYVCTVILGGPEGTRYQLYGKFSPTDATCPRILYLPQ